MVQEIEEARSLGVTGVPHFIVKVGNSGRRFSIPGAQDPETFARVLEQIISKTIANPNL